MLNIRLEIERIDYERCIEQLLPKVIASCAGKAHPTDAERFLTKLGDDAVPVAKNMLRYLSVDDRDRTVVWIIESNEEKLTEIVNQAAQEFSPNTVRVGLLQAEDLPGTRLSMRALQVNIDYARLFEIPAIRESVDQMGLMKGPAKMMMKVGSGMSPEKLEKMGISLLGSDRVKKKVLDAVSEAIGKAGVAITFRDMVLENSDVIQMQGPVGNGGSDRWMPEEIAQPLMDAAAAWLKATVSR